MEDKSSLYSFLEELDEKRRKSLSRPADTPRIGIFWLHVKDAKVQIFFFNSADH
jgi:hypothetical protein